MSIALLASLSKIIVLFQWVTMASFVERRTSVEYNIIMSNPLFTVKSMLLPIATLPSKYGALHGPTWPYMGRYKCPTCDVSSFETRPTRDVSRNLQRISAHVGLM